VGRRTRARLSLVGAPLIALLGIASTGCVGSEGPTSRTATAADARACLLGGSTSAPWTAAAALTGYEVQDLAFGSGCVGVVVAQDLAASGGVQDPDDFLPCSPAALASSDGGRTFRPGILPPTVSVLWSVIFSDPLRAWAVGGGGAHAGGTSCEPEGVILRTSDGGLHWSTRQVPPGTPSLHSIAFADEDHGWAVGGQTILATSDGGSRWFAQSAPPRVGSLEAVTFVGSENGYAVGSVASGGAAIIATGDGGRTWTSRTVGIADARLASVHFEDAEHGWAAGVTGISRGGEGLLLATTDGGRAWHRVPVPQSFGISGVWFVSPRAGWISANLGSTSTLYRTTDSGGTWSPELHISGSLLGHPFFLASGRGWIAATAQVFATTRRLSSS
jgi:photosystem II stability/assembly factor-like uncharacterized protein